MFFQLRLTKPPSLRSAPPPIFLAFSSVHLNSDVSNTPDAPSPPVFNHFQNFFSPPPLSSSPLLAAAKSILDLDLDSFSVPLLRASLLPLPLPFSVWGLVCGQSSGVLLTQAPPTRSLCVPHQSTNYHQIHSRPTPWLLPSLFYL